MSKGRAYRAAMTLGRLSGCHQLPERSFFWHGQQFPVCARCTGVFLGEAVGVLSFAWVRLPVWCIVLMCGIMLLDWGIQALGIKPSTNLRRLLTGIICGFAAGQLILMVGQKIIQILK